VSGGARRGHRCVYDSRACLHVPARYKHIDIYMYIYARYKHIDIYMPVIHSHVYIYTNIQRNVFMCIFKYIYIFTYIYIYV